MLEDKPSEPFYLFALYDVLGHRHFNLQVAVVLGPGVVLSHGPVVAVGVCLELLLSPGGGKTGDRLSRSERAGNRRAGSRAGPWLRHSGPGLWAYGAGRRLPGDPKRTQHAPRRAWDHKKDSRGDGHFLQRNARRCLRGISDR